MCDGVTGVPSVVFVTVIVQSMVVLCCVHQPLWINPDQFLTQNHCSIRHFSKIDNINQYMLSVVVYCM